MALKYTLITIIIIKKKKYADKDLENVIHTSKIIA